MCSPFEEPAAGVLLRVIFGPDARDKRHARIGNGLQAEIGQPPLRPALLSSGENSPMRVLSLCFSNLIRVQAIHLTGE
ncbi:hypothetical protein [Nitratireductor pacificus]|uniref:hypothetical protein n=1 Tax=Nitratireductor pacificus TaxID=1231180 RepID=UPI0012F6B551|nr:hypothetical protein [Nitratireductor pacificus]